MGGVIGEDEVVMKKEELEEMNKKIEEFEKVDSGDGKFVVMHVTQMLVRIEHYAKMKEELREKEKRIGELKKQGGCIGEDEVVMKKEELEKMVKQIEEFEKVGSAGAGKMVVMQDYEMLIRINHYESMKAQCLQLETQVKELAGEEGVLVQEK